MSARMDRIIARLERHEHIFDLDRDDLGEDLLDIAVIGVISGMMSESAPDGTRWPALSPEYAARKAKISPGNPISYLYGLMDDPDEIEGERAVSQNTATMRYGKSDEARQEAEWFALGDPSRNRPPRPFYGFYDGIVANATDHLTKHFRKSL